MQAGPKPGDRMGRPRAEAQRRRGILGGERDSPAPSRCPSSFSYSYSLSQPLVIYLFPRTGTCRFAVYAYVSAQQGLDPHLSHHQLENATAPSAGGSPSGSGWSGRLGQRLPRARPKRRVPPGDGCRSSDHCRNRDRANRANRVNRVNRGVNRGGISSALMDRSKVAAEVCQQRYPVFMSESHPAPFDTETDSDPGPRFCFAIDFWDSGYRFGRPQASRA